MTYDLKSFSAFCIRTYSSTLASVARIAILCMPSGAVVESPFMEVAKGLCKIKCCSAMMRSWMLLTTLLVAVAIIMCKEWLYMTLYNSDNYI